MKLRKSFVLLIGLVLFYCCLSFANVSISQKILLYSRFNASSELKVNAITSWGWGVPEVISTISSSTSYHPTIVIDNDYNIHVAWGDSENYDSSGTDVDIFYRKWQVSTNTWSSVQVLSDTSAGNGFSPKMIVDNSGNLHIVWYDFSDINGAGTDYDIFYRKWQASTDTWASVQVISDISDGDSANPNIVADIEGNLHVVWNDYEDIDGAGTDRDIFYRKWLASTEMWAPVQVISTTSTGESILPNLATDITGNIYIVWFDNTNIDSAGLDEDIFFREWNKASDSWSEVEVISTESNGDSKTPQITVDQSGNLHVAWSDPTDYGGAGIDWDLFYKMRSAGSGVWSTVEVVSTDSTDLIGSGDLVSDSLGNIHAFWSDYTNFNLAGTDADIFYRFKNSSTNTWEVTKVISTESNDGSYKPTMALNPVDHLYVVWEDQTEYSGAGTDQDIFLKKLTGTPYTPILDNISPNPNSNGTIDLNWNNAYGAAEYYVYRDTEVVTLANSEFLAVTTVSQYTDTVTDSDTYHYAVIAENIEGNSSFSNEETVNVTLSAPFDLFALLPLPPSEQLIPLLSILAVGEFFLIVILLRRRK